VRPAVLTVAAACCALALGGCGDTLQVKPIPHNILEDMVAAPFPVYWLGASFDGLQVTEASGDASGSYTVQYGNCLQGGQGSCVPPLRVVTSPDNSFLPGGEGASRTTLVRGRPARVNDSGLAISIATGPVVVDVYAHSSALALAATGTITPINRPESPQQPLPAALPDTGYGSSPLPSQLPATVRPLG
jgi:hypothetical protein